MLGVSEAALATVDSEVRRLIDECYGDALTLLTAHSDKLDALAAALLEHETLDEADAYAAAGVRSTAGGGIDITDNAPVARPARS
jgi:cell division protease FtsH